MNFKGQQSIAIIVFLLLGTISIVVLYVLAVPLSEVWGQVSEEFHTAGAFGDNSTAGNLTLEKVEQVDSLYKGDKNIFDQIVFISFVGVMLTLIVFGVFFSDHPIFIPFLIIGLIVVILLGAQLVNFADDAVSNSNLNNKSSEFSLSKVALGKNLPLTLLVFSAVIILIIISRRAGSIGG